MMTRLLSLIFISLYVCLDSTRLQPRVDGEFILIRLHWWWTANKACALIAVEPNSLLLFRHCLFRGCQKSQLICQPVWWDWLFVQTQTVSIKLSPDVPYTLRAATTFLELFLWCPAASHTRSFFCEKWWGWRSWGINFFIAAFRLCGDQAAFKVLCHSFWVWKRSQGITIITAQLK
jgi:hypothetical protein